MADYKIRKHLNLKTAPQTFYPADTVFTGAALNGEAPVEQLNVMLIDANDNRTGPEINIEPGVTIAGLSEA